jgi:transcriptional regulator with XRE-family HTH domain
MTRRRDIHIDGAKVRRLRSLHGLTIQELAEQVGISRQFLGHLETGARQTVTLAAAVRLAAALGVPTEEVAA